MVLKETMENYVKAIYSLSRWGEVRPYQLADYLSVSRPTVSTTVRSLVEEGFVCVDDRKEIHLTRKGLKIAKEMMEKHNVLFNLLVSLGVDENIASSDACKMEHAISAESFFGSEITNSLLGLNSSRPMKGMIIFLCIIK